MKNGEQPRPSREEIASLAYHIWEQRGRPQGQDVEFWLEAERQILSAATSRSSDSLAVQHRTRQAVTKSPSAAESQTETRSAVKPERESEQAPPRATVPSARQPRVAARP